MENDENGKIIYEMDGLGKGSDILTIHLLKNVEDHEMFG